MGTMDIQPEPFMMMRGIGGVNVLACPVIMIREEKRPRGLGSRTPDSASPGDLGRLATRLGELIGRYWWLQLVLARSLGGFSGL